jgi:hypothetical protein
MINNDYIELEKKKKEKELKLNKFKLTRPTECTLIVIDNFYSNPIEVRNMALSFEYKYIGNGDFIKGNYVYPGKRTKSYANNEIKERIQKYIEPFGGKITVFNISNNNDDEDQIDSNGSFQITTSMERPRIHTDPDCTWAGVLYLTPDAPLSAGTIFHKFYDGTMCVKDSIIQKNINEITNSIYDKTKWETVDSIGNVFNRLILFKGNRFHSSGNYFGINNEDSRLFQVFFFSTER